MYRYTDTLCANSQVELRRKRVARPCAMDENKLEFTDVHDRFKSLVETLLSDFLGEMGVSADMFVEIVANSVHLQLNSFVLASILTVVGRHVIHHIVHRSSTT